ncbi:MAG: RNA 2',3'-cyclic phosphodiesterase [Candidatus Cloacimonetes bacterium]|jgi:2'-5' RNA ligase|nr:RNA 2',3'-cyclic phosphodiesterase [Candidatus Cloacimonadota bacterium]
MRTFVALDLPDGIREDVAGVINDFRANCHFDVNWVPKENIHITFQFIGDTRQEDLPEIAEFLENSFKELSALLFTNPKLEILPGRDPKIIWIRVENDNNLILKISKKLKDQLRQMGYKIDSRSLKFHITLGRIKKRLPEKLVKQILTTELKIKGFEVSKAILYQSLLKSQGPLYIEIMNFKF